MPQERTRATVFVYGTAKRKHFNHYVLTESARLTFRGEGVTAAAQFQMLTGDMFPSVTPGGFDPVRGEVYTISLDGLERLDRLEGCPRFYTRIRVRVNLDDGTQTTAWMYVTENPPDWFRPIRLTDGVAVWPEKTPAPDKTNVIAQIIEFLSRVLPRKLPRVKRKKGAK